MRRNASTGFVVFFAGITLFSNLAAAGCQIGASLSDRVNQARYKEHPELILKDFPRGKVAMEEAVAAQIAFDRQFVGEIIAAAPAASREQKEAIGGGMRRFANLCGGTSVALQREIMEKVRRSGDKVLISAYFREENTPPNPADASQSPPTGRASSQRSKLPAGFLLNGGLNQALDLPSASSLPSR
ncbi:hypothetical protein [Rhodoblastus sp.]|jgi:hypothetical protein|uniref:hypothetical protein n=1 Tax=Rhodoblastus sp. TaxID=1962975 RepID=UPI0025F4A327|nr:hypothetical protein [Rhodoblastus sp.]